MKVFLSWSGPRSRAIADVFRRWLPSVLQAVRPYYSPDDVAKGTRWSSEIAKELDASRVGLLVVTPENQEAPWLLFEAGALAKNLERAKVCPLLFGGMEPTDVRGPLVQFQAAEFSAQEVRRVVKMINGELADACLAPEVLDNVFEMWWPKLEADVASELEQAGGPDVSVQRSERDLLEEVLALTRRLASERERRGWDSDHPAFEELFMGIQEVARVGRTRAQDEELQKALGRLLRPVEYLVRSRRMGMRASRSGRSALHMLGDLGRSDPHSRPVGGESTDDVA